ncbi:MAG: hypothetical protein C0174_06240 [Thermodesulfobium narugense]|nr:MAG: hypothetical protein C0174_06240 [Thermodesulfobium narugense]
MRKIWSDNEILLSLRDKDKYKNGCNNCLYWNICRGCRAIAYSDCDSSYGFGGCAAGFAGITILSDATLVSCRRLKIPLGNLRRDSFREIWANSEVLNKLRDQENYFGKCKECSEFMKCRGCRAVCFALSTRKEDRYLDEDPQCIF